MNKENKLFYVIMLLCAIILLIGAIYWLSKNNSEPEKQTARQDAPKAKPTVSQAKKDDEKEPTPKQLAQEQTPKQIAQEPKKDTQDGPKEAQAINEKTPVAIDSKSVATWIANLNSSKFKEQQEAKEQLKKLGKAITGDLARELQNPDRIEYICDFVADKQDLKGLEPALVDIQNQAITDKNNNLLLWTSYALAGLGINIQENVKKMVDVMNDHGNEQMSTMAILLLGKLKDKAASALPALIDFEKYAPPPQKVAILDALDQIEKQKIDEPVIDGQKMDVLLAKLGRMEMNIYDEAKKISAKVNKESIPYIVSCLKDDNQTRGSCLLLGLTSITSDDAIKALERKLTKNRITQDGFQLGHALFALYNQTKDDKHIIELGQLLPSDPFHKQFVLPLLDLLGDKAKPALPQIKELNPDDLDEQLKPVLARILERFKS